MCGRCLSKDTKARLDMTSGVFVTRRNATTKQTSARTRWSTRISRDCEPLQTKLRSAVRGEESFNVPAAGHSDFRPDYRGHKPLELVSDLFGRLRSADRRRFR